MDVDFFSANLFSTVGLVGVGLYVTAYAALQLGFIAGHSYRYSLLNLVAASCVLFSLTAQFNLSSALIQVFWIALSIIGICRLYWIASRVKLTPEETAFIERKLPSLPKQAARRLLDSGIWIDAPAGIKLVIEDQPATELIYLASGEAEAILDGRSVGVCSEGSLIGEVTCLSGDPATASVMTTKPSRYFCIGTGRIRQLCGQYSEIRPALNAAFASDTGGKLRAANRSRDSRPIADAAR